MITKLASSIGKFSVPTISHAAVKRTRLISLIQSLSSRSILFVHAPIGYGKTTAAVQWLDARDMKAAWLSLDEYDVSAADFYRGLLMSFLNCNAKADNERLIQTTLGNENFDTSPLQHTLEVFARFDFTDGPNVAVIDNFHLLKDLSPALSLPILQSRLPVNVRLFVLSRVPPDDNIRDYLLKETIRQIPFEELQFTAEETGRLFSRHGIRLSSYDTEKIQSQTTGWPIALNALIFSRLDSKSADFRLNVESNDAAYLRGCVKNQVQGFWDGGARNILLKTSVCNFITPALSENLTESPDAWDTLERFSHKTGLLMKYGAESYRYQALLREFLLSELEAGADIDRDLLYRRAGEWYKDYGNIPAALDMASKCGDIELLEDISRLHSYAYGSANIGVDTYAREIHRYVLSKLPADVIERSPRLCLESWFAAFSLGSYDESVKWMAAVRKHVEDGTLGHPDDIFMAFFQFAADPEKDPAFIISLLDQFGDISETENIPAFTLTHNMPFYHKSLRDYSEISPALGEYMKELSVYLPKILRPYDELLMLLIEGGVRLERCELSEAKKLARRAYEIAEGLTPELMFSGAMLLCSVHWAEGNYSDPMKLWRKVDATIVETNAFYLSPNFSAYGTDLDLYNGNVESADSWLENNEPDAILTLNDSFQQLVTAKALIVTGALAKAAELLKDILEFSRVYRRTADSIEAGALLAICLWRVKKQDKAVDTLIGAVILAQKHELRLSVVKQGADIVPALQKLMYRLKSGQHCGGIDKAFVNAL
ncbi:MAG: hypothetical protein FWE68_00860, partial [Defluviitaleaceae bacterium]|nr:hypothetical protein [Defluviitaleaceae bacterium]